MIGGAENFVRDFKLNEQSYSEAWSYILSRFDNKRAVIKSLFRNLYNLEPIKSEDQIRGLLDKVEIIIRGLKTAGETIDETFSKFVTYIVVNKLDRETANDWENSVTSTDSYPNFVNLQNFLRIRAFNINDRSLK